MAKLHKPGNYSAKIIDYGLWEGKKGPMATIMFEYKLPEGAGTDRITWFGSFNGGAREITIDALIRCGFQGKSGVELNAGKGSGMLDEVKEFEIVVGNEPNPTKNNELQSRVKFINLPGGSMFREKMADGKAKILMGGLNLEGDFMAARHKVGDSKPAPVASSPNFDESEDIPF